MAVVYSRSAEDAQQIVSESVAAGGRAMAVRNPIEDVGLVHSMIDSVIGTRGRIDFLINNAGITWQLRFDDLNGITEDAWDELLAVNVKGTFNCCRAAAPHLKRQYWAAIVNVGSIAWETGCGSSLPNAVSKAAVHGLTRPWPGSSRLMCVSTASLRAPSTPDGGAGMKRRCALFRATWPCRGFFTRGHRTDDPVSAVRGINDGSDRPGRQRADALDRRAFGRCTHR